MSDHENSSLPAFSSGIKAVNVNTIDEKGDKKTIVAVYAQSLPSKNSDLKVKAQFLDDISSLLASNVLDHCDDQAHGCLAIAGDDKGGLNGYFRILQAAHSVHDQLSKLSESQKTVYNLDNKIDQILNKSQATARFKDDMPLSERRSLVKFLLKSPLPVGNQIHQSKQQTLELSTSKIQTKYSSRNDFKMAEVKQLIVQAYAQKKLMSIKTPPKPITNNLKIESKAIENTQSKQDIVLKATIMPNTNFRGIECSSTDNLFSGIVRSSDVRGINDYQDINLPTFSSGLKAVTIETIDEDGNKKSNIAAYAPTLPAKHASLRTKTQFLNDLSTLVASNVLDRCSERRHGRIAISGGVKSNLVAYLKVVEAAHTVHGHLSKLSGSQKQNYNIDSMIDKIFDKFSSDGNYKDTMSKEERKSLVRLLLKPQIPAMKPINQVGPNYLNSNQKTQNSSFKISELNNMVSKVRAIKKASIVNPQLKNDHSHLNGVPLMFRLRNHHPYYKLTEAFIASEITSNNVPRMIKEKAVDHIRECTLREQDRSGLRFSTEQKQYKLKIFYQRMRERYESLEPLNKQEFVRLFVQDVAEYVNPFGKYCNAGSYLMAFGKESSTRLDPNLDFNAPLINPNDYCSPEKFSEQTSEWSYDPVNKSENFIRNMFTLTELGKRAYAFNEYLADQQGFSSTEFHKKWPMQLSAGDAQHTTHVIKQIAKLADSFVYDSNNTSHGDDVVKRVDENGRNLLHHAVIQGCDQHVVAALIQLGLNQADSDNSKQTCLHYAAHTQNFSAIRGFNFSGNCLATAIRSKNKDGDTAFHIAARHKDLTTFHLLRQENGSGELAAKNNKGETVRTIIEKQFGPLPDFQSRNGFVISS